MSPTVTNSIGAEKRASSSRPSTGERRSELVCRVKYCNTLPDIPFDPKFITYPFESTRFIQYNPTSLERNCKYEVLTEHDLGVTIDLINKDLYAAEPFATLDIADEKLLEEDILTPHDSKRSRHHARSVSWLRRTEYISTEQTRFQPQVMEKVEAKVGFSIKKSLKEETLYMDRESQIKAIDKTFEDNQKPIEQHYSKANVTAVEVLEVFPDFKMWKYPCAQVMFDSDPAPVGRPFPAQLEEMSQAMIRGVMDECGEQFVAYFLPTEDTLEKRRRDFTDGIDYMDEEEYEYKIAREYNWNVKTKASKGYEENYFLVVRPDGVFFNELETRVRLTKRRQKAGQQPNNTRLVVKHRPVNAQEFNIHRRRERQLEPPQEEEEDEEEEEEDEEEKVDDKEEGRNEDSGSDKENRDVKNSKKGSDDDGSSGSDASDGEKSGKESRDKKDSRKGSDGERSSDSDASDGEKSGKENRDMKDSKKGSDGDGSSASDVSDGEKSDKENKHVKDSRKRSDGERSSGSDASDGEKSGKENKHVKDSRKRSDGERSSGSDASDGEKSGKENRDMKNSSKGSDGERSSGSDASDEERSDKENRKDSKKGSDDGSSGSDASDGEKSDKENRDKKDSRKGSDDDGSSGSDASDGEKSDKENRDVKDSKKGSDDDGSSGSDASD